MKTNTLLAMLALAAGCVTRPAPHVTYYTGAITYSSPDGRLPYNRTEALLRREVVGRAVVDTRTESGNSPSMPTDRTDKLHFRVSGGIRQSRITVLLSSRARAGRAGRRFRRTFFDARR